MGRCAKNLAKMCLKYFVLVLILSVSIHAQDNSDSTGSVDNTDNNGQDNTGDVESINVDTGVVKAVPDGTDSKPIPVEEGINAISPTNPNYGKVL